MIQAIVTGIIRAVLAAVGGGYVQRGIVDQDQLTAVIGAVITLVTIGWSVRSKFVAKQKALADAERLNADR